MSHPRMHSPARTVLALLVASGLVACSQNTTSDLVAYTESVKARQKPDIEPLPEFQPYETFVYSAGELRDPFSPPVHSLPTKVVAQRTYSGISPVPDRPQEPLEEFPLDSLRMVGTLERNEDSWALIKASDDTIHRIKPGNYIGQNHGKIISVNEYAVDLTEIIPDGMGGWMERHASVALSE